MDCFYSLQHQLHIPQGEMDGGLFGPALEIPLRADKVLAAYQASGLGTVRTPDTIPFTTLQQIHTPDYLTFLANAWQDWTQAGHTQDAIPHAFPMGLASPRCPDSIMGRLGFYALGTETSITTGSWQAALDSASCAASAALALSQQQGNTFALCRPPGHHADANHFGGYCFLNNAALAAQTLLNQGAQRITIVDVDCHHGNGTQSIFYHRADVQYVSLHADPMIKYPHYWGHADEIGVGAGEGFNHNYPLPKGTDWALWSNTLSNAAQKIHAYQPDALVISLGVDTYADDPTAYFRLQNTDYLRLGEQLAQWHYPSVILLEGGYAVDKLGMNVVNVLQGLA